MCLLQVSIVQKCRKLGVGPGGFYQPGYKTGAKLRLYMMCLGLDWDPPTRMYLKRRRIDRSKPPDIPPELLSLVDRAMLDSHVLIKRDFKVCNAEHILPKMTPDVCIVNFYTENGRLGLHQVYYHRYNQSHLVVNSGINRVLQHLFIEILLDVLKDSRFLAFSYY